MKAGRRARPERGAAGKAAARTALALAALGARLAAGAPLLNEMLVNPAGSDDFREYVEIWNPSGAGSASGYFLLQVDGNVGAQGVIDEVWSLSGLMFGSNGLLLIGNDYDGIPPGGPWRAYVEAGTWYGDPSGFSAPDLGNDSYTWLLVQGFSGVRYQDLDTNNDGVFDATPWSSLADSVGWSDGDTNDLVYSAASLTQKDGTPDAATRVRGNTSAHSAAAWYNGNTVTSAVDTLGRFYDDSQGSLNLPARACLTPGGANYPAEPWSFDLRINEVYIDPPVTNDHREFIELRVSTGRRENLLGFWLLVVDSAGSSVGEVEEAWNLEGQRTGTNGLLLLGNQYDTPAGGPWNTVMDPATGADEPEGSGSTGWADSDVGDNSDLTILLVSNFVGAAAADLDTNDDLVFDLAPWSAIVDSVGIGRTYARAAVTPGFSPDALARMQGNMNAHDAAAWYGGDIEGAYLSPSFAPPGHRLPLLAEMTPGRANHPLPLDSDGDGLPDHWEQHYFAGPTAADPAADADGDGARNGDEYVCGTAPTDAAAFFRVVRLSMPDTTSVLLAWPTVVGRTYRVQSAAAPHAAWGDVAEVEGDSGEATRVVPTTNGPAFYRVRAALQE